MIHIEQFIINAKEAANAHPKFIFNLVDTIVIFMKEFDVESHEDRYEGPSIVSRKLLSWGEMPKWLLVRLGKRLFLSTKSLTQNLKLKVYKEKSRITLLSQPEASQVTDSTH